MTAGLPLMKSVLAPIAKRVLITLAVASATDDAIQKNPWIRNDCTDNLQWRNERYENSYIY